MLPIILQHVRELAELDLAGMERGRYRIITPFPPAEPNFGDFDESALAFGDPPLSGDEATQDTVRAFEFFKRTDIMYYDYSYGIRSDEYRLARLCQKFFLNATTVAEDLDFRTSFDETRNAFVNRYKRLTAGTLGDYEFWYTSPSPVSWNSDRVVLPLSEVERLKVKAIEVYEDLDVENPELVTALVEGIRLADYASLAYDLGSFDVIRQWMDPRLFEHPGWTFTSGSRQLYGEGDPAFAENEVELKLCFAQRFYVVRNFTAEDSATATPVVRNHRAATPTAAEVVTEHRSVDDGRRRLRNALIGNRLAHLDQAARAEIVASAMATTELSLATPVTTALATAQPERRPGFVWVPDAATVPGHWERERAGEHAEPATTTPAAPVYRVAAVKCRLLSPRP